MANAGLLVHTDPVNDMVDLFACFIGHLQENEGKWVSNTLQIPVIIDIIVFQIIVFNCI